MRRAVWVALLSFWVVGFNIYAENGQSFQERLGLQKKEIDGATIWHEGCFTEKISEFESMFAEFKQRYLNKDYETFRNNKAMFYQDIESVLGADVQQWETYDKVHGKMVELIDTFDNIYRQRQTVYLLLRSTIKDYLRNGGSLPNFAYDKATDEVEYRMSFNSRTGGSGEPMEMSMPISSLEAFETDIMKVLSAMQETQKMIKIGLMFHEIVEPCLAVQLGSSAPYLRWFREGMADVIALEIILKYMGGDAVEEFLTLRSTEKYEELQTQVNLRYWMLPDYCVGQPIPLERESRLNHARYNYAFAEARGLVDRHGVEVIRKILDKFREYEKREADALYGAIKEVTGEDMELRLQIYQVFVTPKSGMQDYAAAFQAAQEKKDLPAMIFNLLRALELYDNPFRPDSVSTRKMIAFLFYHSGHEVFGDTVMTDWVREAGQMSEAITDKTPEMITRTFFMQYAMETDRPLLAVDSARMVLEEHPEDTLAMTIIMMEHFQKKEYAATRELGRKICDQEKDSSSVVFRFAVSVLEKLKEFED